MPNFLKKILYPEYRKAYKGFCSDCGGLFPLVELQPDPLVRDAIKRYISTGTLDFENAHLDDCYCPTCYAKRFSKAPAKTIRKK